jgi:hypothetical protein
MEPRLGYTIKTLIAKSASLGLMTIETISVGETAVVDRLAWLLPVLESGRQGGGCDLTGVKSWKSISRSLAVRCMESCIWSTLGRLVPTSLTGHRIRFLKARRLHRRSSIKPIRPWCCWLSKEYISLSYVPGSHFPKRGILLIR